MLWCMLWYRCCKIYYWWFFSPHYIIVRHILYLIRTRMSNIVMCIVYVIDIVLPPLYYNYYFQQIPFGEGWKDLNQTFDLALSS